MTEAFDEEDFGGLQKDRIEELRLWSHSVQGVRNKAKYAIVTANNHYAGFGPAITNSLREDWLKRRGIGRNEIG